MEMTPEQVKLALGIVLAACLFAGGWFTRSWYDDSVNLKIEQVKKEASLGAAQAISEIKVQNQTIYQKTIEKITTEVQYKECKQDATMLELTNKALTGE